MSTIKRMWRDFWKGLVEKNRSVGGNRAYRRGNKTGGRILRVGAGGKGRGV